MENKQMKRSLTFLTNKEMQIKTTMCYHFIPTRMAKKRKREKEREK